MYLIVPFLISFAGWPWKRPHLAPSAWAISFDAFIGPGVAVTTPTVPLQAKGYGHSIMRAINKPTPSVTRQISYQNQREGKNIQTAQRSRRTSFRPFLRNYHRLGWCPWKLTICYPSLDILYPYDANIDKHMDETHRIAFQTIPVYYNERREPGTGQHRPSLKLQRSAVRLRETESIVRTTIIAIDASGPSSTGVTLNQRCTT